LFLYKNGYTSIHVERSKDQFQNIILIRACFLHSLGSMRLQRELPNVYKKLRPLIDSINLIHFVKNPSDRKKYNL